MRIIEQSAELIKHDGNPYELIETVARTCYKSESRGNPLGFVKGLQKSGHWAMLEHEYVYFKLDGIAKYNFLNQMAPEELKFINVQQNYVSGSFRSFLELAEPYSDTEFTPSNRNNIVLVEMIRQLTVEYPDVFTFDLEDCALKASCGTVELMSRQNFINDIKSVGYVLEDYIISALIPHTIRFITSRCIANEIIRHRVASYAQESTRYVGYDKDKYGSEITVIKPLIEENTKEYEEWKYAIEWCETVYMNLRNRNIQPQIARGVLPQDLKAEIVVTATEQEWQHIMDLRFHGTTGAPHPQIKTLMGLAYPILAEESEGRIQ